VVAANPAAHPVTVRFTSFGSKGVTDLATVSLAAGQEIHRPVPATEEAAATSIEYFGGWVGAGVVLRPESGAPGLAALRCAPAPRRTWFLPDELTTPDRTSYLVVMNPFAEVAEFDVIFQTENRTIGPGSLTPVVLQPRRAMAIRVNAFALQAPSEETMAATVITHIGRVVAGSLGLSPGGIRAEVGIPGPERQWVLPAANHDGVSLLLMNPSDARADLSVVAQGPKRQTLISSVEGVSVAPQSVSTLAIDAVANAGILASATNQRGFVAALRLVGPNGDPAELAGTSAPSRRWLVVPATPPDAGRTLLVVQNSGQEVARLTISLLGPDGPVPTPAALASIEVPPGRTISLPVRARAGVPLSVAVVASSPIVAGVTGTIPAGYSATLGLPMSQVGA
jgi:hypothetical protein